jgi:hypothetical protein
MYSHLIHNQVAVILCFALIIDVISFYVDLNINFVLKYIGKLRNTSVIKMPQIIKLYMLIYIDKPYVWRVIK